MKLPTPEKLPSGMWRVRVLVDGRRVSITKPTEKECIAEAAALKAGQKQASGPSRTVSQAIDSYISDRENILSVSTVRGYRMIQRHRFQSMMPRRIADLNQSAWQRAVNLEASLCSAKTLKNAWGFMASVIHESTGQSITVRLPQIVHDDKPFLSADQIPVFLQELRGDPYEIPILLGLSSLRRSEILAVRWQDIDLASGCIHVHGSAVQDIDNNLVQKETNKNTSSRRTIPFILPQLRQAILESGPHDPAALVADCYPNTINVHTNIICRRAGLPQVGAHGLRRSYASLCYHLGLSEEFCMRTGGWSDIYIMRKIYTGFSTQDMRDSSSRILGFFK